MPNAAYYARNREKLRADRREWGIQNREHLNARFRERRDPAKTKVQNDRWYGNNRDKAIFNARVRRQHLETIDELQSGEWEAMVDDCGNCCIVPGCGASPVTKDHVIPVTKGGRHHISNLQPLCGGCNDRKGVDTTDYRGV